MELAGDPRLLFRGGASRLAFALPLEPVGLLLDLADIGAARADAVAEQRGRDQEDDPGGAGTEPELAGCEHRDRDGHDRGDPDRAIGAPLAKRAERIEGDAER